MERVSINNIVVRFFTDKEVATSVAHNMGLSVFQHENINRFVLAKSVVDDTAEIFDSAGVIFSEQTLQKSPISKVWQKEFVASLQAV